MPAYRPRLLCLALCLAVLAIGCGRNAKTMRVWGSVNHDGRPVAHGLIVFFPADDTAGPSTGATITSGEYDIPARSGPRAGGVYRVEITAYGPERMTTIGPDTPPLPERDQLLPPKFNHESTLRASISDKVDDNRLDFDLQ